MTTGQARGIKQGGLNDLSVAEYLQTYPDFFERNGPLLAKLRLPHLRDAGATVSLVERQVEVLRERNQSLERKTEGTRGCSTRQRRIGRPDSSLESAIDQSAQPIGSHQRGGDVLARGFRRDALGPRAVSRGGPTLGGGGGDDSCAWAIRPAPTSRLSSRYCSPASRAAGKSAMRSATTCSGRTRSRSVRWR